MNEEAIERNDYNEEDMSRAFNNGLKAGDDVCRLVIARVLEKSDSIEQFIEWLKKFLPSGKI